MFISKKVRVKLNKFQKEKVDKVIQLSNKLWNEFLNYTLYYFNTKLKYPNPDNFFNKIYVNLIKEDKDLEKEMFATQSTYVIFEAFKGTEMYFKDKIETFPKFKNGTTRQFRVLHFINSGVRYIDNSKFKLPILGEIEFIEKDYVTKEDFNNLESCDLIKEDNDLYYFSIRIKNIEVKNNIMKNWPVGISLNIYPYITMVDSHNRITRISNINTTNPEIRRIEKHIQDIDEKISHVISTNRKLGINKTSKNLEKLYSKRRKLYRRITNIRDAFIKKICHDLVVNYNPDYITIEDLDILGEVECNKCGLAYDLYSCKFRYFREFLTNICKQHKVELRIVKKNTGIQNVCSKCGHKNRKNKLDKICDHYRTFVCQECGYEVDASVNTATNLLHIKKYTRAN